MSSRTNAAARISQQSNTLWAITVSALLQTRSNTETKIATHLGEPSNAALLAPHIRSAFQTQLHSMSIEKMLLLSDSRMLKECLLLYELALHQHQGKLVSR